jgi:hypothetical protein
MLFATAALNACGIGEGDYIIYRVAFGETEQDQACFAGGVVPPSEAEDSTTAFTAGTFILYMGPEDSFYLDTGNETLEGKETDDGYKFEGRDIDVNYSGINNDTRESTTRVTEVKFDVDGALIDGKMTVTTDRTCSGSACPDPPNYYCKETTPFIGSEIEDVELRHNV